MVLRAGLKRNDNSTLLPALMLAICIQVISQRFQKQPLYLPLPFSIPAPISHLSDLIPTPSDRMNEWRDCHTTVVFAPPFIT